MFEKFYNFVEDALDYVELRTGLWLLKIGIRLVKWFVVNCGLDERTCNIIEHILRDIAMIEDCPKDYPYRSCVETFLYDIEFDRYLLSEYVD